MTWTIRNETGTELLNSSDDLGVYLLDVIDVNVVTGGVGPSYNVPAATRNSVTNYNYSTQATRIWPVVISKKVWNYGWRPVLENWTGPNDTTFSVAWRNLGGSNVGDAGYTVYVFGAGSTTTTGTYFNWKTDNGTNEYISENRAPMRFLSSLSVTATAVPGGFFGPANHAVGGTPQPAQNGVQVLPSFALPIVRSNSGTSWSIVPNNFNNVSTQPWALWSGANTTASTTVYWFTSRWPRTTHTATPFMRMRDSSGRVFFDTRERYLRVLDIQVTANTPNGLNGHTNDGTTVITFDSTRVPSNNTWGYFTNVGGLNPSPNSASALNATGRTLVVDNNGVIPSPVIAVAVDLTGL